jgi:hypothetical protein
VAKRAGVGFEALALGRQVGAGARAVEEPRPHRLLQRGYAGRDGGLRDPQPFRRAVEAAGLGKVEEGVE